MTVVRSITVAGVSHRGKVQLQVKKVKPIDEHGFVVHDGDVESQKPASEDGQEIGSWLSQVTNPTSSQVPKEINKKK